MKYGICLQSVAPVRKQPGDQSEMTNQLLFGDLLLVYDNMKQWRLIETIDDKYAGWIDQKQVIELEKDEFDFLAMNSAYFALDPFHLAYTGNKKSCYHISLGSKLPNFSNGKIQVNNTVANYPGKYRFSKERCNGQIVGELAKLYLGAPYLWGGRSFFGIDCSGLVQVIFSMCGINLARDSNEQVNFGQTVSFINDSKPGDLAFFDNEEHKIIHVGILLGNHQVIHASGVVRIDPIDHFGIFNAGEKKYTHNLRIIKRIMESE